LDYPEAMAGGFMTTTLVVAQLAETVEEVIEKLKGFREHSVDIDGVVVVDENGVFIDDLGLFDILIASKEDLVFDLVHEVEPVMVGADYMVKEVVDKLKASRRSSVIVVDDGLHPIGRVLADDVIDALGVGSGFRFRMPWNR
jgi:Mg/Co/Ni transporter MgtE